MAKNIVLLVFLGFSLPTLSGDLSAEVDALIKKCINERSSLMFERQGAPSCEQVTRLIRLRGGEADLDNVAHRLSASCNAEERSMLKERHGSPSCEIMDEIIGAKPRVIHLQ